MLGGVYRSARRCLWRVGESKMDLLGGVRWSSAGSQGGDAKKETVGEMYQRLRVRAHAGSEVFDRELKLKHRDRAAHWFSEGEELQKAVSVNLVERFSDMTRKFPKAVVLGGAAPFVSLALTDLKHDTGIEHITYIDSSKAMLDTVKRLDEGARRSGKNLPECEYIEANEECLPLEKGAADVIITSLGMHWINDIEGTLKQCMFALKPDGLFLGSLFGGRTLQELRISFSLAEQEREGGVSPRISPLIQLSDAGGLLSQAGFKLTTVDVDEFVVKYKNLWELVDHLRVMGESHASLHRRPTLSRDTALAAATVYEALFDEEGWVPSTYQVAFLTGWAPAPTQPKPAKRGSASASLADLKSIMDEMDIKRIDEDGNEVK